MDMLLTLFQVFCVCSWTLLCLYSWEPSHPYASSDISPMVVSAACSCVSMERSAVWRIVPGLCHVSMDPWEQFLLPSGTAACKGRTGSQGGLSTQTASPAGSGYLLPRNILTAVTATRKKRRGRKETEGAAALHPCASPYRLPSHTGCIGLTQEYVCKGSCDGE